MQKQWHCTYPLGLGETLYVLAYSQAPRAIYQGCPSHICQVYGTKNWTKGYGFIVCRGGWWGIATTPPGHGRRWGYPRFFHRTSYYTGY
jgi:hypothetical protein